MKLRHYDLSPGKGIKYRSRRFDVKRNKRGVSKRRQLNLTARQKRRVFPIYSIKRKDNLVIRRIIVDDYDAFIELWKRI